MRQFHLLMSEKIHTIAPSLDEDLGCPVFLLDAISDLRVILGAYESSFVPASDDYQEISAIFNSALHPYLQQCEEIAKSFPELLQCIILSNCIDLVKMTLKLFSSAKNELDALNSKSQDIEQRLILQQHSFFLDSSGLRPFLKALETKEKDVLSHSSIN
jgi:conserved oligomeric Golgi complex subunit 6